MPDLLLAVLLGLGPLGPGGAQVAPFPLDPSAYGALPAPDSCHYQGDGDLPDPSPDCTPGVSDPRVTPDTLAATVCNRALHPTWSQRSRPPTSYTEPLKRVLMAAYGVGDRNPATFELDHLRNIASGGHPADWHNLWPQPYTRTWGAHIKDALEVRLGTDLCRGQMTLAEVEAAETMDWRQAYDEYVAP